MFITIQQNAMGHLHVWPDIVEPVRVAKYNYHADGQESPVYIQNQAAIGAFLYDCGISDSPCAAEYRTELDGGYSVYTPLQFGTAWDDVLAVYGPAGAHYW